MRHPLLFGLLSSLIGFAFGSATLAGTESSAVFVDVRSGSGAEAEVVERYKLYGASHAMVIGIDNYTKAWPKLSNAIKDARLVAEALESRGFEVELVTDPDGGELREALRRFFAIRGTNPDARLFVWFAGHGHTINGEGYLVPANAPAPGTPEFILTALHMRDVGAMVRIAQARHALVVFDACFSGTIFTTQRSRPPVAITNAATQPVRQFLSSGAADQQVSDDGTFRRLFIDALEGREPADLNQDGYVTGTELGFFLEDRMTNLTEAAQTPRSGKLRDIRFDRGDFVFVSAASENQTTSLPRKAGSESAADEMAVEMAFWRSIEDSQRAEDYLAYLEAYPQGRFAPLARSRTQAFTGSPRASTSEETVDTKADATGDPTQEDSQRTARLSPNTSSQSQVEAPGGLALPAKPSIAVLPLKNVSGDTQQDYFSDGITEDIITDLSKFGDLFVIASNTVFTYKGKPVNVQDISRQLGVRYVLEGSVQRAGEKVRVNAQLIDGTTGHLLWAERLVREMDDLFALQEEIVRNIVAMLAIEVNVAERRRAMRKSTDNLEAYDYVLQGRQNLLRSTSSSNSEARALFLRAIELDSSYASAYVALGQTYLDALRYGWTATPSKALQQVHDLAQKALSLEERNSAAHRLLGYAYLKRQQYDLASREFERALEVNPNDADSHDSLGAVWLYTGRTDAAISSMETALRFNPELPSSGLVHLGLAYYLMGRYRDAVTTLQTVLGRHPNLVILHVALAAAYAQTGRGEDAARAAAEVLRLHPFFEVGLFGNGFSKPADRASIREGLLRAGLK